MKNLMSKCSLLICLILISCTFVGCGGNEEKAPEPDSQVNAGLSISAINVITAEQNEQKLWKVMWPTAVITGTYSNNSNRLESAIKELSEEETDYFLDYVESMEILDSMDKYISEITKEDYEGHQYLGSVEIIYYDEEGKYQCIKRYIFDEYPAGYSDFIGKFGEICGEDYIPLDYNIQDVTLAYFRRMAAINAYVSDEDVEEFLNITECDMFHLLESYNYSEAVYAVEHIKTYRHLPKEILCVASDENELTEYVKEIANKFDVSESSIFDNQEGGYFFPTKFGNIEIYPSNKYPYPENIREYKWNCSTVNYYVVHSSKGEMVEEQNFVYSEDGKFMILIPGGDINEFIDMIFDD